MVRMMSAVAAVWMLAGPASAQSVDWARAGGDLFGRPAVEAADLREDTGGVTPRLTELSQPYAEAIARAAERHGVDEKLLHALVIVESAYRPNAVSPAGAGGLTQLMPGTAADLGVRDRFDVEENLSGGADYLARQLLRFGDLRLALAAYNSGPGRVARLGRIPDIEETRNYVVSVIDCYLALTAGRGVRNAPQCRSPEAAW
jgi:soluble lytic murein transglycosylase-like protein